MPRRGSGAWKRPCKDWVRSGIYAVMPLSQVIAADSERNSAVIDARSPNLLAISSADSACANFSSARDSSLFRHLMISAFGVSAACGAEPMPHGPIAYVASQILPGTFTYRGLSITDDAFTSVHAPTSLTISRTRWKGTAALLAVRAGSLVTGVHLDSLIVSTSGPTALYFASWYTTQHPMGSIHANFDSSSVTIVMRGHLDSAATFLYRMKVGELPFGFSIPLLAPALPLAKGWHGVIDIAPPIHPRAAALFFKPWESMALRVVGREKLHVAAGAFDCWKVQLGDPHDQSFMWVDAVTHIVVRSQTIHRFGDTSFEDQVDLQHAEFVSQ